jgi:hypothetical protein
MAAFQLHPGDDIAIRMTCSEKQPRSQGKTHVRRWARVGQEREDAGKIGANGNQRARIDLWTFKCDRYLRSALPLVVGGPLEHGAGERSNQVLGFDPSGCDYTAAKGQFADKKLRALAIDANQRWPGMADVPTLGELGYKDKVASWFAVAAPAGTPPTIVKKLNEEFVKASRDPALVRRLTENGTPIETTTPEQMSKMMAEEWERMVVLVKELDLKQK